MKIIDTHTTVKELIAAGFPEKQAEVFVEKFVIKEELNTVEKEHSQLATKADVVKLESKIENIGIKLESKIDGIESRLESKIENTANGLSSGIRDLMKDINWLKTITIANFTLLLGGIITTWFNK